MIYCLLSEIMALCVLSLMMFLALERMRVFAMSDREGRAQPMPFSAVLMTRSVFLWEAEQPANHTVML